MRPPVRACGGAQRGETKVARFAAGWQTGNIGPGPGGVTAAGERELGKELQWKACTAGEAGWEWDPGQACATQTCLEDASDMPKCVPADVAATNYGT